MTTVFPRTIAAAVLAFVVQVAPSAQTGTAAQGTPGPSRLHGPISSRTRTPKPT